MGGGGLIHGVCTLGGKGREVDFMCCHKEAIAMKGLLQSLPLIVPKAQGQPTGEAIELTDEAIELTDEAIELTDEAIELTGRLWEGFFFEEGNS